MIAKSCPSNPFTDKVGKAVGGGGGGGGAVGGGGGGVKSAFLLFGLRLFKNNKLECKVSFVGEKVVGKDGR